MARCSGQGQAKFHLHAERTGLFKRQQLQYGERLGGFAQRVVSHAQDQARAGFARHRVEDLLGLLGGLFAVVREQPQGIGQCSVGACGRSGFAHCAI